MLSTTRVHVATDVVKTRQKQPIPRCQTLKRLYKLNKNISHVSLYTIPRDPDQTELDEMEPYPSRELKMMPSAVSYETGVCRFKIL